MTADERPEQTTLCLVPNRPPQQAGSVDRVTERLDAVGAKVKTEIDTVMAMIGAMVGNVSAYAQNLAAIYAKLGDACPDEGVRQIVESLAQASREMERGNRLLDERLAASKQEITELQAHLVAAHSESLTDPLTLLPNRKCFDDAVIRAAVASLNRREAMSFMMADVDHFKTFNDSYGHLVGDQVLRIVANAVKQNVKGQDIVARYGGEEFAVVLPNTALRSAITVAEQIRRAIMMKDLMRRSTKEHLGRVTVSIGVAQFRPDDSIQSLIERADLCLYAAKRTGRNRTVCESDPEFTGLVHTRVVA